MNLGILIIVVSILGYFSNWFNWRYLDFFWVRFLYRIGVIVHELFHALFCVLTFAEIKEISLFSKEPHVTYTKSKIPFLGNFLISVAPLFGGLGLIFLVNKFFLADYFTLPQIGNIKSIFLGPFHILSQINLFEWQSWLTIFLLLNIGATIGPSFRDLKNIWPLLLVLLFVKWQSAGQLALLAIILILTNILLQITVFFVFRAIKAIIHLLASL